MPLPALFIPIAIAGGSAVAQAIAKLKSHERLNALRAELEELEADHRAEMQRLYERQTCLSQRMCLPEPTLPAVLREPAQTLSPPPPPRLRRLLRRLLRRDKRTLADGSPHSRAKIIGRHGASFTLGAIWKAWSATIMNLLRPMAARLMTLFPSAAPAVGAGSSLAFAVSLRLVLGVVAVVGIVVGPLLASWAIFKEVRLVRRARRELEDIRTQRHAELAMYRAETRQIQRQLTAHARTACRVRLPVRAATPYAPRNRRAGRVAVRAGRSGLHPFAAGAARTASAA